MSKDHLEDEGAVFALTFGWRPRRGRPAGASPIREEPVPTSAGTAGSTPATPAPQALSRPLGSGFVRRATILGAKAAFALAVVATAGWGVRKVYNTYVAPQVYVLIGDENATYQNYPRLVFTAREIKDSNDFFLVRLTLFNGITLSKLGSVAISDYVRQSFARAAERGTDGVVLVMPERGTYVHYSQVLRDQNAAADILLERLRLHIISAINTARGNNDSFRRV